MISDTVSGDLGEKAFQWCTSLASIVIPDSVTGLGFNIFNSDRNLSSVVIPDSVTVIGVTAFDLCACSEAVYVPGATLCNCTPCPTDTPTTAPTPCPTDTPTAAPTTAPTTWCDLYGMRCDNASTTCANVGGAHRCLCRRNFTQTNDSTRCVLAFGDGASTPSVLKASSPLSTAEIVGIFVAIAILVIGGLVFIRLRLRSEHGGGPTNFQALREKLFVESGFGTQYDVGPDEIGLALTLLWLPTNYLSGRAELTPEVINGLLSTMERATASKVKHSTHRSPHLAWKTAKVWLVATDPLEAAVVVKLPDGDTDPKISDVVLGLVQRAIQSDAVQFKCVDGATVRVTTAALMLPQVVPREIDRELVIRLGELGSGSESVVWRAQVADKARRHPPFPVALKEPRQGGGVTRDDIELEAAMMALLDHSNVVRLVGVVTMPREMPAVLIIEFCEYGALDEYLRQRPGTASMVLRLSFCADVASGLGYLASRRVVHRDVAARNVSHVCMTV